jgi:predicted DNA-binding transcriptional regulator YafY
MFALMVASKAIEQYQATPFHQPLQMAFHKLTSQLNNQERYSLHDFESILSFRAFAPEITDLERFETITRASHHGRAIRFEYRKPGAPQSEMRHVHPYHVACLDNSWYLVGYDEARSDTRTFVINRICGSVFVGDKFPKPLNFDINKYLRGSFAIMKGEGNYEVVIQFDAWSTDVLRHRLWHSTQQITALPGGGCRLAMRLTGLEEVERWILSWGCHATVLQPASLRDRLAKIAQDLAAKYASP